MRQVGLAFAPALVLAVLGCREELTSPSTSEAGSALDITPAQALSFREVSVGLSHTCGVTSSNLAYCWGLNLFGQLGDGTTTETRPIPVAVAGGLRFRQVSAGSDHTCGVTTDSLAYCWGFNHVGQLGDGTTDTHLTPVLVASVRRFRSVIASFHHSCGVTRGNRVLCWGLNDFGQLGDRTTTNRLTPVLVSGGLRFDHVDGGVQHTCGLTSDDLAYCWGGNIKGQLGDGTRQKHLVPTAVAGGLRFRQLTADGYQTCGRSLANQAYCWGFNKFGQLGDGTTALRLTPVRVHAAGRRFSELSAGQVLTCGVAIDNNQALCWGANMEGQLGDGTTTNRLTPVPVAGGHLFRQVSEGSHHSCAVSTDGRAFCWGAGGLGELGDGMSGYSLTPVAVAGPS
jgi:alpha-tubulin suppressor-like RCC1 family protein